jgi:hypothetical protein
MTQRHDVTATETRVTARHLGISVRLREGSLQAHSKLTTEAQCDYKTCLQTLQSATALQSTVVFEKYQVRIPTRIVCSGILVTFLSISMKLPRHEAKVRLSVALIKVDVM